MNYTEWQLRRIRDALRAFKAYGRDEWGNRYSWRAIRELIAVETNSEIGSKRSPGRKRRAEDSEVRETGASQRVSTSYVSEGNGTVSNGKDAAAVGAEILRRFVEGVRVKGKLTFPVPKDDALEGIVSFVLKPEFDLLSEEELCKPPSSEHAPMRLLEYLSPTSNLGAPVEPEKLEGTYFSLRSKALDFVSRELVFSNPLDSRLFQVEESEDHYDPDDKSVYETGTAVQRERVRKARICHDGWAVVTPEKTLFLFLKKRGTRENRYYFTLLSDLVRWREAPVSRLYALQHSTSLELDETEVLEGDFQDLAQRRLADNLLLFERPADS